MSDLFVIVMTLSADILARMPSENKKESANHSPPQNRCEHRLFVLWWEVNFTSLQAYNKVHNMLFLSFFFFHNVLFQMITPIM